MHQCEPREKRCKPPEPERFQPVADEPDARQAAQPAAGRRRWREQLQRLEVEGEDHRDDDDGDRR